MKTLLTLMFVQLLLSCSTNDQAKSQANSVAKTGIETAQSGTIAVDLKEITKDFNTWYSYYYYNIKLAQDFTALNTDASVINKNEFLSRLNSGMFIPVRVNVQDGVPVYKLLRYNDDPQIRTVVKQMASYEIANYKREGEAFQNFDFKDLNGRKYTDKTTKGKIMVLKCWFIHCVACVAEFPELNKLVDDYKKNKDVLFISLATDSQKDLQTFLEKKPFNYAVVADREDFMTTWGVTMYPTHILIKNGKVIKVTNEIADLIPFLERESAKARL